jgi:lipopolysaccharide transport system permease protein
MQEIRHRYKRSTLGVFWITGTMAVLICTIGFVFSHIFNTETTKFIPFLSAGFILWGFLSQSLSEGCLSFVNSEEYLKMEPLPLSLFVFKALWFNLIVGAHNAVIFLFVMMVYRVPLKWQTLYFFPGLLVFTLTAFWLVLLTAVLSTRYRDIPPIISNIVQVLFYLTPIVWLPSLVSGRAHWILYNPFYHLLEIVRQPLLGAAPSSLSWVYSLTLMAISGVVALAVFGRFRDRVMYWL